MTDAIALPDRLLLATRNEGKRRELSTLIEPLGVTVLTLDDAGLGLSPEEEQLECFDTFEENALAKAHYFFARAGIPTLADDSGLVVDALAGRPGVHSRRWSGRTDLEGRALDAANNAALMQALDGAPQRSARFVCVAVYVDAHGEVTRRGEIEGRILSESRGTNGFGYDPYFQSLELGRTLAEAGLREKGTVSHRGRAMRALWEAIVARAEGVAGH